MRVNIALHNAVAHNCWSTHLQPSLRAHGYLLLTVYLQVAGTANRPEQPVHASRGHHLRRQRARPCHHPAHAGHRAVHGRQDTVHGHPIQVRHLCVIWVLPFVTFRTLTRYFDASPYTCARNFGVIRFLFYAQLPQEAPGLRRAPQAGRSQHRQPQEASRRGSCPHQGLHGRLPLPPAPRSV
jgi:hypothetical protein